MMKKIALAAAIFACVAAQSQAVVNINWYTVTGFYSPTDNSSPLLGLGQSALIQLINAGADGINPVNPAGVNFLGGDDTLLASVTFVNNTSNGDDEYIFGASFPAYQAAFSSFTFYARVFQDATPAGGEKYFDTATQVTVDKVLPDNQALEVGATSDDRNILNNTIVPEPSVLAFLGLGGLVVAVRRRMIKA